MPVRLVATNDWRPSSITERRLLELEREGLLRRRTSLSSPKWIAPVADQREPRPPKGYVVSFAKFHRHGLGAPPSCFMRALCHHYGRFMRALCHFIGYPSIGVALLRFLKSMHTWSFPFFL